MVFMKTPYTYIYIKLCIKKKRKIGKYFIFQSFFKSTFLYFVNFGP